MKTTTDIYAICWSALRKKNWNQDTFIGKQIELSSFE